MSKKISQIRNIIVALLAIEFVIILLGYLLFKSTTIMVVAVYTLFKNIVLIGTIFYLSNNLDKVTLSVSEALDSDAKNAFIFGGVGLIKYDNNRNIVWVSDLFTELNIKIVGNKLLEWQPLLASLFEEEDVKIIDIKSRKYEVYNSKESRLLYLKDVTDFVGLSKEYKDQQLCIAYINIDNYDELVDHADEQTAALVQSTARQTIIDWANDSGIILKRYRSDAYIGIFNERIYRKQVESKFNILDIFKEKADELNEVMTLSIGIGRGSKVLRELEEAAVSAIALSCSRGGDQVTVKSGSEPIRYFGGNSENFDKNNRIRSRVIAQSLSGLIKKANNILIMGHKQSDFDSFGASIAMLAICRAHQKKANIILDFDSLEEKTGIVAKSLIEDERYRQVFITPARVAEYNHSETLLIVVDNHKPSLAISEEVLDLVKNVVVIDHHRRGEEFIQLPILTYLEPSASSSVELITELFDYQKVPVSITEREATIMYTGMLIDTNDFKTRVSSRTFQVAAKLRNLHANVAKAHEYVEDDYETTLIKLSITRNAYQFNEGILIAFGNEDDIYKRVMLAKVSNELLAINGINAVFTIGRISKTEIAISARSSSDINVQLIMEKLGGGGHFSMAACQLKEENISSVITKLEEVIDERVEK